MIYTLTINPALDYIMHLDEFCPGVISRSKKESIHFGGKGINVSLILKELGQNSVATGFAGGFTGKALADGLGCDEITSDFVMLKDGMTRINVKLRHGEETDINAGGPHIKDEDVNALFQKLDVLRNGDILVLAGSVPKCLNCHIYSTIMQNLSGRGVKFAVDAEKDLLLNTLKYKPFIIKPNSDELCNIFGVRIDSPEEAFTYAEKLQQMGAVNVLVSLGGDGAVLLDQNKNRHFAKAHPGKVINTVGAGDSMLAGFIAGYEATLDFDYALKLGTACGGATAFSEGLADFSDIQKLLAQ